MAKLYLGNDLIIDPDVKLEKVELTQAQYNALTTKDSNKLYIITDATDTVREDVDLIYQVVNDQIIPGMTDINNDLQSSIQSFCNTALYPYGGYSADKGYYLMDQTNLSEDQIVEIAVNAVKVGTSSDLSYIFSNNLATMLLVPITPRETLLRNAFLNSKSLEYIYFKPIGGIDQDSEQAVKVSNDSNYAFANCNKLKRIEGVLDFENVDSSVASSAFINCTQLSAVNIKNVHTDLDLSYINALSDASVKYLIENRSGSNQITLYLSPIVALRVDTQGLATQRMITIERKSNT